MKLPQLSLRELFLLVVIAAMGCGWWVRERQLRSEADEWKKQAQTYGYKIWLRNF